MASAMSASAISVLPGAPKLLGGFTKALRRVEQESVAFTTTPAWRDQGILNLARSPYAKLHSVPVHAVTIESGFWSPRRETNVNASIPSMGKLLEVNGRMDNFRRLTGKSTAAQRGPVYSDSDITSGLKRRVLRCSPASGLSCGPVWIRIFARLWRRSKRTAT